MKNISFEEFAKKVLGYKKEIPEYIKPLIELTKNNKRICVPIHRKSGRNDINRLYKEYLEYKSSLKAPK